MGASRSSEVRQSAWTGRLVRAAAMLTTINAASAARLKASHVIWPTKVGEARQWPEHNGGKWRVGKEEVLPLNGDLGGIQTSAEDVRATHPVDLKVHLGLVREPCEVEREGRSGRETDHPERQGPDRDDGEPPGGSRRPSSQGVLLRP